MDHDRVIREVYENGSAVVGFRAVTIVGRSCKIHTTTKKGRDEWELFIKNRTVSAAKALPRGGMSFSCMVGEQRDNTDAFKRRRHNCLYGGRTRVISYLVAVIVAKSVQRMRRSVLNGSENYPLFDQRPDP